MSEIGGGHMHRPENQQCGVLKYARYILKKYWELVIYGVVGVCTTVVNVVVFQILSENGLALFWSNAAAFVISVLLCCQFSGRFSCAAFYSFLSPVLGDADCQSCN